MLGFFVPCAQGGLMDDGTNTALVQTAKPGPTPTGFELPRAMIWLKLVMVSAGPLIVIALWKKNIIRPGSFERRGSKRDVLGLPAPAWFGCAGVLYLSPMLGAAAAITAARVNPGGVLSMRDQGIMALSAYSVGIGMCVLLAYLISPHVPSAGLKYSWRGILRGIGAILITLPILEGIALVGVVVYTWVTGESPAVLAHPTLREIAAEPRGVWVWGVIFGAVIGAPVVEECVFRLFLQSGLLRATRSHWLSILVTSAAFALVHRMSAEPVPWHTIPVLFALGLAMGIAFERTGRIWVPIVMHIAFNALSIAMVMMLS